MVDVLGRSIPNDSKAPSGFLRVIWSIALQSTSIPSIHVIQSTKGFAGEGYKAP